VRHDGDSPAASIRLKLVCAYPSSVFTMPLGAWGPGVPGAERRSTKVEDRFSVHPHGAWNVHGTIAKTTALREQEDAYSLDADPAVSMGSSDQQW